MKKYITLLVICLAFIAPFWAVSAPVVSYYRQGDEHALESNLWRSRAILEAILELESGGDCSAMGGSGETGCLQYQPATWKLYSEIVLGEVVEQTYENEVKVAMGMFERWFNSGKTEYQIALLWNQGHDGACSSGVNKYGVHYDSCAYAQNIISRL